MKIFLQKSSNLFAENRLLKFAVVIIGGAVLLNIFMTQRALKSQRVVITPPLITAAMGVNGYGADEEYIKQMTRYILGLALTYTPATAKQQFAELLAMFGPEEFQNAKRSFGEMADTIKQTGTSSVFHLQRIIHDPKNSLIEASGVKRLEVSGITVENKMKTYFIGYRFENGRFRITEISEKEQR